MDGVHLEENNTNFLPEQGAFAATGVVNIHPAGEGLEIVGNGWKRSVKLVDGVLTVEQPGLAADHLAPTTQGNVGLSVDRRPGVGVYSLK